MRFKGSIAKGLLIALALSLIPAAATSAAETSANTNSDDCKISVFYSGRGVHPAFPVSPETLSAKKVSNLLVLRFSLSDLPNTYSTDELSLRDSPMKEFISKFSSGAATVNVNYSNYVYKSDVSTTRWRTFYRSPETYKFVRQMLIESDAFVDFTNVDGVIFQGPWRSNNWSEELYEGYILREELGSGLHPFETSEKKIYSGLLMGGFANWLTYTHEIMHPFGLTDLYDDGTVGGPLAFEWSLMASNNPTLFLWERWQLGWLKSNDVLCFDLSNTKLSTPINATLHSKTGTNQPRMLVVRLDKYSALVVEIRESFTKEDYKPMLTGRYGSVSAQALVTYTVDSRRSAAPIRVFGQPAQSEIEDLRSDVTRNYGDWTVYISEASPEHRKIHIWSAITPNDSIDEIISATKSRIIREKEILEAKLQAAAKAEMEAEAKLQAAAKAEMEAEAKAAAKAAAFKKTRITCSKGKLAKKVTAIKPVCPKGFKKK